MTDDLDSAIAGVLSGRAQKTNTKPDPLDNAVMGVLSDQRQDLRVEVQRAVRTDPMQAVEADKLSKQYPVPRDVLLRNIQEAKDYAAVDAAFNALEGSPTLADYMRKQPWALRQAHQDLGALTAVAQFFSNTGSAAKAGLFGAAKGASGLGRAASEFIAPPLDILENVTAIGGNPLRRLAEGFAALAEQNDASMKAVQPKGSGNIESGYYSGVQSLTQNLLALPMAFAPGGQGAALTMMTGNVGGQSYQDAREKGLPMSQAIPFAASQAAIEYATEKLPLGALLKDVKAGTPFFQTLMRQVALEIPGEQVATVLQDLNEWAVLNPDKPFTSYLDERPDAAAQTLVATIVGAGGNVAVMKGIEKALTIGTDNAAKIADAERVNAGLQEAMKAAAASQLREANPETFQQLVQYLAENNEGQAPTSVFIDAQVLAQSGVNVAEVFPGVVEQMDAALATNGSVEVPISEVLTAAPGTPLEQVFLQNARATPDGISMAEAEQAFQQADQWKQEADRVMAEAQDQAAWQASADNVKANLLGQLNTAGRFTPEVNEAYSTMVRDFYATMAGRLGITPDEMYQRYPLRIAAQGQGGQQLDQGKGYPLAPRDEWYGEGTFQENGGRMVYVTPDEYIAAVRPLTLDDESRENIDLLKEHIQAGKTLDPLLIRADGKEDGRHRAYAAKELGIQRVPVIAYGDQFAGASEVDQGAYQQVTPYTADTITVDGKERPTTNSNGQRIAETEQGLTNFWRWFGDSRVVDAEGKPLVVYHGTRGDFTEFDMSRAGENMQMFDEEGAFFTTDRTEASEYARIQGRRENTDGANVMAVYVKTENPLTLETYTDMYETTPDIALGDEGLSGVDYFDDNRRNILTTVKDQGRDGVVFTYGGATLVVAFNPTQIKSAIGNDGTFSGQDANILRQNARGTYSPDQLLITLNANADLSTFLHESGHFFLEVMADLASQPNAPADIQDDMGKLLKWFGIKGDEQVGGPDAGGELAQLVKAVRAEVERAKSPVTGKPEFALYDAEGNRLGVYRNALTADEALSNFNSRQEVQRQPEPQVRVDAPQPASSKEPRSNWKIVRGQKFTNLDEDDDYLYHVTSSRAATDILRSGLVPNSPRAFGDAYAGHSANRVFLTERGGVSFWQEKVEQNLQALYDRPPAVTVVRIPKNKVTAQLQPDEIGSADARRPAYYAEGQVLFQTDGKFKPTADTTQPAGRTPLEVWNAMTLDQKRVHHERFAESFEQYLLEGRAPSQELQPLFRKFRSWLVNVYKSLTQFMRGRDLKLSDEVRQVFDRMLAADEAIRQQEEASGLLPDFDATNEAIEKLQARSLRDLKWTVNARSRALKALQKEAAMLRKGVEDEVRAEVEDRPEVRAKRALDELRKSTPEYKAALADWKAQRQGVVDAAAEDIKNSLLATEGAGLKGIQKGQFLAKNRRRIANEAEARALAWERENAKPERTIVGNDMEIATVAEANGYGSVDEMLKAIDQFGDINAAVEGMTDQRMLENFGELATPEAIEEAANDAVHNEARAKSLATELKAQADMLNVREQVGTATNNRAITVNALAKAAKEFGANIAARRRVKDLKRATQQHRAAEAKAGKRWQEATAAGKTQDAVQAKRDQVLNNATVKALNEAQAEVKKIREFFARVTKDGNEKLVDKGRDPDVVNAMRAILAAYDVAPRLEKGALEYMDAVAKNDPTMYAALQPSVQGAMNSAKPLDEMTVEELRGLADEMRGMWYLSKRSRQSEIDGNLLDREALADELLARMTEIGIPDTIPGERGAITTSEEAGIKLQFAKSILSRVEQWAERFDGKFGGPFLRYVFQPIKEAADRYRTDRVEYRKKFTALLDKIAPTLKPGPVDAPELGYTFGNARDSGVAELLHAILHTGNESNKRKLLLGRNWATENADGTLDTSRWDAFITRMINTGVIQKAHYDFAQGVWDLLEETKPLAQKTHREVFGRYFAEVTADPVVTPFGTYKGGYVPAQTDSRIVKDAKLRELAEGENESMAYAFPASPSGFTKSRVEYNKPLLLDLRALAQHMDKVLLFSHMQGAVTDVRRLLTDKRVSYALDRIDPGAYEGMLIPWLNRAAKQVVETPVMGDRKISRFLSAARSRAGMALMMANLSNTVQQVTGFTMAAVKVKPSLMMSSLGQFVASPKQTREAVASASPYMRDRMLNEVGAMNDAVEQILVDPTLLERGQAWTQRHAYFMQSAVDNMMSPIIWTAAYNQATEQKMTHADAVRFADGVIRQTQGSTLPEDISRFESGPAYARLFTQFVSYFNMMANTNATAVSQIANEMGLRKGAGKLLYVALAGLLAPIWVAEAIALAFKGGPDDEDQDGYLDDWLAAVFGLGTIKGLVAQVPIAGQAAQLAVNQFNTNPADDKFSLSPAVSLIESTVRAPKSVYDVIVNDGKVQKAVRDVAAAATMVTGLPFYAVARPLGYTAGVAAGEIEPTSEVDAVRGVITGTASPESKQR